MSEEFGGLVRVPPFGFVRLVDHMGGDARIAEAARVSYSGASRVRSDADLIDYLVRHGHSSPLEQVVFTFHLRMPMFVARQWLRHRTARVNEISGRYVELKTDFFTPVESSLRAQESKQGRGELLPEAVRLEALAVMREAFAVAERAYGRLNELGVTRELARVVLPAATYTEFYWQMDLRNLLHFLDLRLDEHAQEETREFAGVIFDFVESVVPLAVAAWMNHQHHAVRFSNDEMHILEPYLQSDALHEDVVGSGLRLSRVKEFQEKLVR
jgi:thymidylate synthase (FAD)